MHFFEELGGLVEQSWKKENFDNSVFAEVASAALRAMPPCERIDYRDIAEWVFGADSIPPQNLFSAFGEPPLILYWDDRFYIEALFWLDTQTSIHEHGLEGAFHILEGSSLHCRYKFELKERINSRLLIGDIRLREVECLSVGDTRSILPGRRFIHSTFHLEKPTVTIIVRTRINEEARPQYTYLLPSVAYDPVDKRELLTRQLDLLQLLQGSKDPNYARQVRRLITRSDLETAFWVLEQAHRHLNAEEFAGTLTIARERHGELLESFPRVFEGNRRSEKINGRCPLVENPVHRLLLGLLLGLPNRAAIFTFLRRHYEGFNPVDLIMKWVEEMATTKAADNSGQNILGVRFDEASLLIFRSLLEGLSFKQTKERLKTEYDSAEIDAQEDHLSALHSALKTSALFAPLFIAGRAPAFELGGRRWKPASLPEKRQERAKRSRAELPTAVSARRLRRD